MKEYYEVGFPAGKANAARHFEATLESLKTNPEMGRPSEIIGSLREFPVSKTPFTLVYQVSDTEISVIRVRDQRSNPKLR